MPGEPAGDGSIRAILLDIEGTTTSIDFVYKTLFPYARRHLGSFLREHAVEVSARACIEALRTQHVEDAEKNLNPPAWREDSLDVLVASAITYALWLMDRDSKCSALKSLQGRIWREGYEKGELHGEVYPDVPPALVRWTNEGKIVAIFSSGSVLAQKLLFCSTPAGDLTKYLRAYFDTATGPKDSPRSYVEIAKALGVEPPTVLFVSDLEKELNAAQASGMHTTLSVRPGNTQPATSAHRVIDSFNGLLSGK